MPSIRQFTPEAAIEAIEVPPGSPTTGSTRVRASALGACTEPKRDQWNAERAWMVHRVTGEGPGTRRRLAIYGSEIGRSSTAPDRARAPRGPPWQLDSSAGEPGALVRHAQIVNSVPWYEAKMYGSTQVMDEARHVEVYRRFVLEKLGNEYPVNPELKKLLDQILEDSRWDIKFLGMQIIVEGLALAAFGTLRDTTNNPLLRDLIAYVMEDEARHVAFGVLSLREYCQDLSEREKKEREDFVYEACVLMRDRIKSREMWERLGLDADLCIEHAERSGVQSEFRHRLFSKIVPNVKSLGLLSERQRARFHALDIPDEHETTSDAARHGDRAARTQGAWTCSRWRECARRLRRQASHRLPSLLRTAPALASRILRPRRPAARGGPVPLTATHSSPCSVRRACAKR